MAEGTFLDLAPQQEIRLPVPFFSPFQTAPFFYMSSPLHAHGVHFIGDFSGSSGVCQSGRDLVAAFQHLGHPCQMLDIPFSSEKDMAEKKLDLEKLKYTTPDSPVSIITWNSDVYEFLAKNLPAEVFKDRYIIGICYWETSQSIPDSYRKGLEYINELWVVTDFVKDVMAHFTSLPIAKYPYYHQPITLPKPLQLPPVLDNDRFTFLFSFDARSVIRRKNPEAVCEAFIRAFPTQEKNGPLCVIKSAWADQTNPLELLNLKYTYKDRQDIIFIDTFLSIEERDSLQGRADCYISLHRSEGLGLTMMESMALGKPCIATSYSGNLEFMTPDNSWLIPHGYSKIGVGASPYAADESWADPDINAAAAAMREVFSNTDQVRKKAARGRDTILKNHSIKSVGSRIEKLLNQSFARHAEGNKSVAQAEAAAEDSTPTSQGGRAAAYQLLKESKKLDSQAKSLVQALQKKKADKDMITYAHTLHKMIKLQRQAQSEILREIGDMKQRVKPFQGFIYDAVLRDRDLTIKLLKQLTEEKPEDGVK